MTSKFKVGDKVRIIENARLDHKIGQIGKILEIDVNDNVLPHFVEIDGLGGWYNGESLELIPSKNQRITALEETVALQEVKIVDLRNDYRYEVEQQQKEINELKLIVAQIRKPSTVVQESLTATTSSAEEKPQSEGERLIKQCEQHISPVEKSPNEKRAEMIEKAKMFVDAQFKKHWNGSGDLVLPIGIHLYSCEFISNKNTTVALLRLHSRKKVSIRGIAKCMPDDVFNEHIGKAIALGRALWLDVSEFEQAVQPTVAVGQIVKSDLNGIGGVALKSDKENYSVDYAKRSNLKIINDTNAQYLIEVVE